MEDKLELITSFLAEEREKRQFPGLSASIVQDQETFLARGWGLANLDTQSPAGDHTTYRTGSITKVFTSMLVMQAVERGLFGLDDPTSNTIPEVSCLQPFGTAQDKSPIPITLRHCITHTSGLPVMPPLPELTPSFEGIPTIEDLQSIRFPQVGRIIETLAETELQFMPGEGHAYSNFGMTLAGEAAARKMRMSYREAMLENLLKPLGMAHSGFNPGDRLAAGYFDFGDGPTALPDYEIAGFAPAGGIFSSAADIARFMAWNFRDDPAPILSSTMRAMMRGKQRDLDSGRYVPGSNGGMGLGWFLSSVDKYSLLEHGGADMGYVAFIGLIPDLKLGVFLATNTGQNPTAVAQMAHDVLGVLAE